ncbi:MAG: rod shape-determining protein MreC [Candidatus Eisenbacteria bacterium]|nr:rod shape-determining protein MreC [Candidatus Eisenbacteria bacterium]
MAVLLSLSLIPLGKSNREGLAAFLEHSAFLPFRAAVGWGPRSLASAHELARYKKQEAEKGGAENQRIETEAENRRLRLLLGFERRADYELLPATVVGRGREKYGDVVLVRPSDPSRVSSGMPVVCADGLIGRVSAVRGSVTRVEGLKHRNVAVSVINQRSREEGIVKWRADGSAPLVLQGISSQSDWQVGDRIVTSGLGAVFPRGLLVGWVMGATSDRRGGLLRQIAVQPASSLARAEEVFILLQPPMLRPEMEETSALFPLDPARTLSRQDPLPSETFASGPAPTP